MTPEQFIAAWHRHAGIVQPRYHPRGWLETADDLIGKGITEADLERVAKWMRREQRRAQNGERGSTHYHDASFAWRKIFGERGASDEGERFCELLTLATPVEKPAPARNVVPMPAQDSAAVRAAAAEHLRQFRESSQKNLPS